MLTVKSLNSENRKVLYYEGIRWDSCYPIDLQGYSDCPGGLGGTTPSWAPPLTSQND